MEQEMVTNKCRTVEQDATSLRCPRCRSWDTKFRYFNNHNIAQPRHYCRTCKRQWTVGGSMRNIPVGGKTGNNGKQSRAPSSRYIHRSRLQQRRMREENPNRHTPPMGAMLQQNLNATNLHPVQNLPTVGSAILSYTFKEEISFLDAIHYLIEPQISHQYVSEYEYGYGGTNTVVQEEWSIKSMQLQQQGLSQQTIQSYQIQEQGNNVLASHSFGNALVQLSWPPNQNTMEKVSFSASNSLLWNNIASRTGGEEMNTPTINVDDWLNFPCDGPS